MSAFCVYGVSRSRGLDIAKRRVDFSFPQRWTFEQAEKVYDLRVGLYAAILFGKEKPKAVSARFDAPEFAKRYMDLAVAAGDLRQARIMALTPTGQKDPKTKMEIVEWRPYAG